jgi:hypothetical protein
MTRRLAIATLAVLALAAIDFAWHYSALPAQMASHFDFAGNANGHMARGTFVAVALGTSVCMALLFWGIAALLPRLPAGMINLPHRDFWLAPENRPATFAFIRRSMLLLGLLVQVQLAAIFHLTLAANLRPAPAQLNGPWLFLGTFAVAFLIWIVHFVLHFYRPGRLAH